LLNGQDEKNRHDGCQFCCNGKGVPGFAFGYAVAGFVTARRLGCCWACQGVVGGREGEDEAWWTRTQRIRTAAAVPMEVAILDGQLPPVYQRIAAKADHLHELGMTQAEIGRRFGVDRWTVGKAIRWLRRVQTLDGGPRSTIT